MKLRKVVATGLFSAMLIGSCLSASAAPSSAPTAASRLTEEQASLVLNVEAYKQAYPDLAAAFGNNTKAYLNHYLTHGIYEGRTKGALFDPLTYAEAYGDIRASFGYDVNALVNHYVTFGAAENRTMGTSHGYADIAAAENSGMANYYIPRTIATNYKDFVSVNNSASAGSNTRGYADTAAAKSSDMANYYIPSAIATNYKDFVPVGNSASAGGNTTNALTSGGSSLASTWDYDRSVAVFDNDTLIRVEYYDKNNQMIRYSDVTNVNGTNSYTETIYYYDEENGREVLDRTDTYTNGSLESSVAGSN